MSGSENMAFLFGQLLNYFFVPVLSQIIYKSHSKVEMSKVTTPANALDIQRAKWAQQLTNKASLRRRNPSTVCLTPADPLHTIVFSLRVCVCPNSTFTQTWRRRRGLTIPPKLTRQTWDSQEE